MSEDDMRRLVERVTQDNGRLKDENNNLKQDNNNLKGSVLEVQRRLDQLCDTEKELEYRRMSSATHHVSEENWESRLGAVVEQHTLETKKANARIEYLEKEITVMEEEVVTLEKEIVRLKDSDKKLALLREEKRASEAKEASAVASLKSELESVKQARAKEQGMMKKEIQLLKSREESNLREEQKNKTKENTLREELEQTKKATKEESKTFQAKGLFFFSSYRIFFSQTNHAEVSLNAQLAQARTAKVIALCC